MIQKVGDVILRLILLVGMIVVFSSGVYLSWRHTLHMAERHGFTPDEALVYTILVETLLSVAELVVIFRATLGKAIHASVYVGVGVSVIINLVGNVSSFWSLSNWGVALGASITAITAIAVWIFATALAESDKTADRRKQTDKTDSITTDIDKPTSDSEQDSIADRQDKLKTMGVVGTVLARQDSDIDSQTETDNATSKGRQDSNTTIDNTIKTDTTDDKTRQTLDKATRSDTDDMTNKMNGRQTKQTQTDADDVKSQDGQNADIDKIVKTRQTGDSTTRQQTGKTATNEQTKQQTDKKKQSVIKIDKEKFAREKALEYYRKNGRFPSFRQLGEMTGFGKDKAGKIIRALKQKVG